MWLRVPHALKPQPEEPDEHRVWQDVLRSQASPRRTDPRFSLDAGRISLDDPRYSFDEPQASWDGYLIRIIFPKMPTMVSVVEDAPVHVLRSDTQIPVEENAINEDETSMP
jgi:hypothetical protein